MVCVGRDSVFDSSVIHVSLREFLLCVVDITMSWYPDHRVPGGLQVTLSDPCDVDTCNILHLSGDTISDINQIIRYIFSQSLIKSYISQWIYIDIYLFSVVLSYILPNMYCVYWFSVKPFLFWYM